MVHTPTAPPTLLGAGAGGQSYASALLAKPHFILGEWLSSGHSHAPARVWDRSWLQFALCRCPTDIEHPFVWLIGLLDVFFVELMVFACFIYVFI